MKIDDLQQSVRDLTHVDVVGHGTSGVKDAFDKVRSNADAAIAAARSEFSSETSALQSSISDLSSSVHELSNSPLTAVPAIPGKVSAVATAVRKLVDAARSKCS